MNAERWLEIKNVVEAVLDRPTNERAAFIDKTCGADGELASEVESLLAFETPPDEDIFENSCLPTFFSEVVKEQSNGFIGKQIGKYRVVRELGAGGMGVVFLAERSDGAFEQKVAIKFLRHFSSVSALQRFLLERKILARLHHRFIAQLIDGGTTAEGTPYLVMEFVEGRAITRYADEHNLNLEQRLELFCKVCSAVSFAHQNLIVHRDLKPANILITEEGIPKLLDFGIAKLLSETEVRATVTEQQAFTPEYASPEQIKGETITTASDVYVLGIILYELLCGKRPFQNLNTADQKEIWYVVNHFEPPKPSEAAKSEVSVTFDGENSSENIKKENFAVGIQNAKLLKGDLDNIVLKALKREPERRYKSVEQLTEDLRRYRQHLPIKARPDTFFYRIGKFAGRQRWSIAAVFLVVSSLLIGIVATIQQSRRAEIERIRAEQRSEDLRSISKSLVFDVHDAIRNLAGSLPARKILLEKAVEQLQLLARDAADNPNLQAELAQAYFNVGEMQQAAGDVSKAEEFHRRAVAIYQELQAQNPHNQNYSCGLARGFGYLANIAYLRGESVKSVELYAQIPPILKTLAIENPKDTKILAEFWDANFNYAVSLIKIGKSVEALPVAEESLQIAGQLNEIDRSTAENRQSLYQSKGLLAMAIGKSGAYADSIEMLKQVIDEAEKLHSDFPEDTRFQYDLWAFRRRIGINYGKNGNFNEAVSSLEKSRTLIEDLMNCSPTDAGYKRNTAVTLLALGQTFNHFNEYQKALKILPEAQKLSEKLLAGDDRNGETIADLAEIYGNLAIALAATGKFNESLLNQEKSVACFKKSLEKSSDNSELKNNLADLTAQINEKFSLAEKQNKFARTKEFSERENSLIDESRRVIGN